MNIRKTTIEDIPRLQEIFAFARRFMAETGNPNQWSMDPSLTPDGKLYPSIELLQADVESGDSYVCVTDDGRVVATFVLRGGNDPTYDVIVDGAWPNDHPYATIHRIASSGEVKGVFSTMMNFALQHYTTLRIDTHRDNRVMQNAALKAGFVYCGIIYCWSGAERLAYQFDKK